MMWLMLLPLDPTDSGTVDVSSSWFDSISIGQVIAWIAAVVAVAALIRQQRKSLRPLENFFRDWNGEPMRPGVEPRPGVMERLQSIEGHLKDAPTRAEFAKLQEQVTRNTAVLDLVVPKRAINIDPPADLPPTD